MFYCYVNLTKSLHLPNFSQNTEKVMQRKTQESVSTCKHMHGYLYWSFKFKYSAKTSLESVGVGGGGVFYD